jgi:hypothetical protein
MMASSFSIQVLSIDLSISSTQNVSKAAIFAWLPKFINKEDSI